MSKQYRAEYITKYIKVNIRRYELKLNRKKDLKIIEWLDGKKSINSYLKELVEQDMKKAL